MSEVKRYTPSMKVGHMVKDCDGLWIRSQDFYAAQSELAALREELADLRMAFANRVARVSELSTSLTAAEQRNEEAVSLLHDASIQLAGWVKPTEFPRAGIIAFLSKPTESGASE
jgi:hypothetical protein